MRQSEYRVQLREKQKTRRYYQVLEKQFRAYYDKASRQDGVTGENLLRLLESRFDNVLVRLGFAASRRQARQLISHGHWLINGRRVDIPSYQVRPEDVISIKSSSSAGDTIRKATELVSTVPAWLQADHDSLTAKVLRYPERAEISAPVQEQLIVELYSK
jgi:small subunit ribosomal protein S4